jgi:hypothetical protein
LVAGIAPIRKNSSGFWIEPIEAIGGSEPKIALWIIADMEDYRVRLIERVVLEGFRSLVEGVEPLIASNPHHSVSRLKQRKNE